ADLRAVERLARVDVRDRAGDSAGLRDGGRRGERELRQESSHASHLKPRVREIRSVQWSWKYVKGGGAKRPLYGERVRGETPRRDNISQTQWREHAIEFAS